MGLKLFLKCYSELFIGDFRLKFGEGLLEQPSAEFSGWEVTQIQGIIAKFKQMPKPKEVLFNEISKLLKVLLGSGHFQCRVTKQIAFVRIRKTCGYNFPGYKNFYHIFGGLRKYFTTLFCSFTV